MLRQAIHKGGTLPFPVYRSNLSDISIALDHVPHTYEMWQKKQEGVTKIVINPWMSALKPDTKWGDSRIVGASSGSTHPANGLELSRFAS